MNIFIIVAAAIIPALAVVAFVGNAVVPGARIRIDGLEATGIEGLYTQSTSIDLGALSPNILSRSQFQLINKSSQPMQIDRILASCGCTKVVASRRTIEPGKAVAIDISIDPALVGLSPFEKNVQVQFSQPSAQLSLTVSGRIDLSAKLSIYPNAIDIGNVAVGQNISRKIFLRGDPGVIRHLPKEIGIDIGRKDNTIVIKREAATLNIVNHEITLNIGVPLTEKNGPISASEVIIFDGEDPVTVTIPIHGTVIPSVRIQPSQWLVSSDGLLFYVQAPEDVTARDIHFTSDLPVAITYIKDDSAGLLFKVVPTISPSKTVLGHEQFQINGITGTTNIPIVLLSDQNKLP